MAYEWRLNTPKTREFREEVVRVHEFEREPGVIVRQESRDSIVAEKQAHIARLVSAQHDSVRRMFLIRLIFGYKNADGVFQPADRDEGIAIGGPEYTALNLDPDGSIDEPDLLRMCAQILHWDGSMAELDGAPTVDSLPTESL